MIDISSLDIIQISFLYVFFIILGACLGSFASAIIPREMSGQSWFSLKGENARSRCPPCGKTLSAKELIPIVSYFIQRKRCACGKHPLPFFYPALEIISIVITLFVVYAYGVSTASIGLIVSLPFFLTACHVNFKGKILSDRILIVLAYIAVGTSLIAFPHIDLMASMAGAGLIGVVTAIIKLIYDRFSSHELYKWDTVKLWIILGFWIGAEQAGLFLFLIGLGGALWCLTPQKFRNSLHLFPYNYWSLVVFYILYLSH